MGSIQQRVTDRLILRHRAPVQRPQQRLRFDERLRPLIQHHRNQPFAVLDPQHLQRGSTAASKYCPDSALPDTNTNPASHCDKPSLIRTITSSPGWISHASTHASTPSARNRSGERQHHRLIHRPMTAERFQPSSRNRPASRTHPRTIRHTPTRACRTNTTKTGVRGRRPYAEMTESFVVTQHPPPNRQWAHTAGC